MRVQPYRCLTKIRASCIPRWKCSDFTQHWRANANKSNRNYYILGCGCLMSSLILYKKYKHDSGVFSSHRSMESVNLLKSYAIPTFQCSSVPIHHSEKAADSHDPPLIFSGTSNVTLASDIANHLGRELGAVRLQRFADGEVNLQYLESLRGRDVYVVQPTCTPVNENLVELLLMISCAARASARNITAVIPYYGYARQDRKMSSRVPISAADVAKMLEAMGVDRVICVDLHCGQLQGFFGPRIPADNLESQVVGIDYFSKKDLVKPIIVSPDAGGVYRANSFQEGLISRGIKDVGIAMIIKQRNKPNEIAKMDLVGDVQGSDAIIVDDLVDTAGTLVEAAGRLKKAGARRVFAFAVHGLLNGPAIERIEKSDLEEVIVTDSIDCTQQIRNSKKIKKLSIAVLIAEAIKRVHQGESLQDMFIKMK